MTTADECLSKAKVGDIARVCFEANGFDRHGRIAWVPVNRLTAHQFNFDIIKISYGQPVVGALRSDPTMYGFSPNREGKYPEKYSQTYVLYQRDIKTVKIFKN